MLIKPLNRNKASLILNGPLIFFGIITLTKPNIWKGKDSYLLYEVAAKSYFKEEFVVVF